MFSTSSVPTFIAALLAIFRLSSSQQYADGTEQCSQNSVPSSNQCKITVRKSVLKFFSEPPAEVVFTSYESAVLECMAGGVPPPVVYWARNGAKISPVVHEDDCEATNSTKPYLGIGNTNARLRFDCVRPEDSGIYTCAADNGKELLLAETVVKVTSGGNSGKTCSRQSILGKAPQIVMWTSDRFEYVGGSATLFCRAEGESKPITEWYKMDNLNEAQEANEKYDILAFGDLLINNISWDGNLGYVCMVRNQHGSVRKNVFLHPTTVKGEILPKKAWKGGGISDIVGEIAVKRPLLKFFVDPPTSITFSAFRNGTLECVAFGIPPPVVYWTKDGIVLSQMQDVERPVEISTDDSGANTDLAIGITKARVYIDCATPQDSGEYMCVADNGYQTVTSTTTVTVVSGGNPVEACPASSELRKAPKIVMFTGDRFEYIGRDVRLFCRAEGDPDPDIAWYDVTHEDEHLPVGSGKYEVLENGDLIIRNIQWSDNEDYACVASNIHGTDRIEAFSYPTVL